MKKATLLIHSDVGLHARPAATFVQKASQFCSEISLRNLTTLSNWVNAKSILNVLALGVEKNHEIELQACGDDENLALESLSALVDANFGEIPFNKKEQKL